MRILEPWILILLVAAPLLASATPPVEIPAEGRDFGAADQTVMLKGRITDVCQRKGCWTVIAEGDDAIRVRFQDYGFFLPKDSVGVEAWAQGRVSVVTMSESEARHYEAESRDGNPSEIEGPQREIGFTATGVHLVGGS
ncbi:MAG: DUF4920 domain-containing protein [Deltaproteobacteria bacterium]|nr:DUF4920 domain-containing protein [Deltaproteobacteria bacterium]